MARYLYMLRYIHSIVGTYIFSWHIKVSVMQCKGEPGVHM